MTANGIEQRIMQLSLLTGQSVPILQAPIGPSAVPELAAAVAGAGGLGGLALTWSSSGLAHAAVTRVLALQPRARFFGNFVLHFPCEGFEAALDAGLPIVTFSWGIDARRIASAHQSGARVGVQVGHPEGARRAVEAGADFLIAQGIEAGGHVQSSMSLGQLLPQVLNVAGGLPVVAAGGIASAAAIAKAFDLGASGVMMGTRFVASNESAAHEVYKRALVLAGSEDTANTPCFDIGWPAMQRVLRNETLTNWEAAGCPLSPNRPNEGEVLFTRNGEAIPRYSDTAPLVGAEGNLAAACLYAGTGVGEIQSVEPASELVTRLWSEARSLLH